MSTHKNYVLCVNTALKSTGSRFKEEKKNIKKKLLQVNLCRAPAGPPPFRLDGIPEGTTWGSLIL